MLYAELDLARGDLDGARRQLDAAAPAPDAARPFSAARYACLIGELAASEGRFDEAARAVDEGIAAASPDEQPRLYALALRIEADRAQLSSARRDAQAAEAANSRAANLLAGARDAAAAAGRVSPEAPVWAGVAEAERGRMVHPAPQPWHDAATAFDALERPYVAAYCRWREAEAHVAAGAARGVAAIPARAAYDVALRLRARLLQRQIELLAQRARLYVAEPAESERAEARSLLASELGLTRREAEVLELVARGYTNREIAESLFLSVKTASVHVTNILRKLRVSNRVEAAAAAHRVTGAAPP
jgi:DNA-binding CsgD family transcriptional regulator